MKKLDKYFQCTIKQGSGRDVTYIEERGAYVGAQIELGGFGTNDFWEVESVSDKYIQKQQLKELEKVYREGFNSLKPRIPAPI
jgi:hypothetical protein